jgi:hypothetical protein
MPNQFLFNGIGINKQAATIGWTIFTGIYMEVRDASAAKSSGIRRWLTERGGTLGGRRNKLKKDASPS